MTPEEYIKTLDANQQLLLINEFLSNVSIGYLDFVDKKLRAFDKYSIGEIVFIDNGNWNNSVFKIAGFNPNGTVNLFDECTWRSSTFSFPENKSITFDMGQWTDDDIVYKIVKPTELVKQTGIMYRHTYHDIFQNGKLKKGKSKFLSRFDAAQFKNRCISNINIVETEKLENFYYGG